MTLFFSTLFFLILNDFFVLNFNLILFVYFLYFTFYLFYSKNTLFLPNLYYFNNLVLNIKTLFFFLMSKFTSISSFFSFNFSLKWKPLFKRSSYFGLYRSTRNQWLNK